MPSELVARCYSTDPSIGLIACARRLKWADRFESTQAQTENSCSRTRNGRIDISLDIQTCVAHFL